MYALVSLESPSLQHRKRVRSHPFLNNFDFFWSYNTDLFLHTTMLIRTYLLMEQVLRPPLVTFQKKVQTAYLITVVSNCGGSRARLIKELPAHIPVHNFGQCHNNMKFPEKVNIDELMSRYKFVLTVENSLCTDYVTEKWARPLRVGSIPVVTSVQGTPNYTKVTPHTQLPVYLDSSDFKSLAELAARIKEIGDSKEVYAKYMAYRALPKEKLNPLFVRTMDEYYPVNRAQCRFARLVKTDAGKIDLQRAHGRPVSVTETCH